MKSSVVFFVIVNAFLAPSMFSVTAGTTETQTTAPVSRTIEVSCTQTKTVVCEGSGIHLISNTGKDQQEFISLGRVQKVQETTTKSTAKTTISWALQIEFYHPQKVTRSIPYRGVSKNLWVSSEKCITHHDETMIKLCPGQWYPFLSDGQDSKPVRVVNIFHGPVNGLAVIEIEWMTSGSANDSVVWERELVHKSDERLRRSMKHTLLNRGANFQNLTICHEFSCGQIHEVSFSPEEIKFVLQPFEDGSSSADQERVLIGQSMARFEQVVGEKRLPEKGEQGGVFLKNDVARNAWPIAGQLDCIDNSSNMYSYLTVLEKADVFRFHRVLSWKPEGFQHYVTTIEANSGVAYAVDAWRKDNGQPPLIYSVGGVSVFE